MKRRILKACVLSALLIPMGCKKDYLNRDPYGILNQSEFFKTDGAGMKLLTSCYQPMMDGWGFTVNKVAIGDEVVDNAGAGGSDPGDRPQTTEVGRGRPLASNALLFETWANRFKGIGNCNIALEGFVKEGANLIQDGKPVSAETVKRYIAEVKFLRAWYYFDLLVVFKEVPLVIQVEDPSTRKAKASLAELRAQVYKDLDEAIAESNLPRSSALTSAETGRVTKDAALALKARAALFLGGLMEQGVLTGDAKAEYTLAKDAAGDVVKNGGLNLLPDFQDLFRGDYQVGPFSKECILGVMRKFDPAYGLGGDAFAIMNVGRNNVGGWGGNTPTRDLAASFDPADPRKMFTIISHNDIFKTSTGGQEVHNYRGYFNDFDLQHSRKAFVPQQYRQNNDLQRSNWQPYWIRYAEVLLVYAEAIVRSGGSAAEALPYVNEVRKRAYVTTSIVDGPAIFRAFGEGLKAVSESEFNTTYAIKASDNVLEAIKAERRHELALEGFRLYDLVRWGTYATTMKAFFQKYGFADKGRDASDKSWPFPIPQIEIDRSNGVLVQNDNY
ncbi:RagB/SusD family nutrient uptake outer membrane protein [Sphingobacterium psychroaquaticum]|uniref:RagB/SusD family nutrient uptake outer membrane protein n=1 Tax=Sphingobacterium psychroaquaticum TaxID=561061 RepID=UPI00106C0250|nr:RagB/SusD family nutrient uptake outer membrane protein [Sphingobacterium psychroaquaticum]QBQ40633.1 RagB/SusD family nutrient uptake outer membrane protein [Sphingobacterium psychroaquaticum]